MKRGGDNVQLHSVIHLAPIKPTVNQQDRQLPSLPMPVIKPDAPLSISRRPDQKLNAQRPIGVVKVERAFGFSDSVNIQICQRE